MKNVPSVLSILTIIGLFVMACTSNTVTPTTNKGLARTSVMITNMVGNSGGSGVVISSSATESRVLTNHHVCHLAENGALVVSDTVKAMVVSYQVSDYHDLCLIKVNANLGVSTKVATHEPALYSESIVVGHPALYPTVISRGNFAKELIVQVMTGFKPCTEEDLVGDNAMFCIFLGGIPVIKTYEAQLTSSLIMPGSSGSPVFNEAGEVSGLVFAGSGDIGFGLLVPLDYVSYFVNTEVKSLPIQKPNTETTATAQTSRSKLKDICTTNSTSEVKILNLCKFLRRDLLF